MSQSVAAEKELVDRALKDNGVDLRNRVWFSTDPEMQAVMTALDRSDEEPVVPGFTKRILPLVLLDGGEYGVDGEFAPNTAFHWHCHSTHIVLHVVIAGHLIVQRRLRKQDGQPVRESDGEFVREGRRLDVGEFWIAWPGEPYGFLAEDVPARSLYFHVEIPGLQPVTACADPRAALESR